MHTPNTMSNFACLRIYFLQTVWICLDDASHEYQMQACIYCTNKNSNCANYDAADPEHMLHQREHQREKIQGQKAEPEIQHMSCSKMNLLPADDIIL